MKLLAWLLTLIAGACALGWICGVPLRGAGFFAAVGFALLIEPGEGRAR